MSKVHTAKFPKGVSMTVDEVAEVVGPEFKEMNENPPTEVLEVREQMLGKTAAMALPRSLAVYEDRLEKMLEFYPNWLELSIKKAIRGGWAQPMLASDFSSAVDGIHMSVLSVQKMESQLHALAAIFPNVDNLLSQATHSAHDLVESADEFRTTVPTSQRLGTQLLDQIDRYVNIFAPLRRAINDAAQTDRMRTAATKINREILNSMPGVQLEDRGDHQLYLYTSPKGRPGAAFFKSKAKYAEWFYSFVSDQSRDDYYTKYLKTHYAELEEVKKKKEFQHTLTVGDILVSSWGYNQTNVDFYQVVKASAKQVTIREIEKKITSVDGPSTYVVADKDEFIGAPMNKKVSEYRGKMYVNINSYSSASEWDGKPQSQTSSGYGH